MSALTRSVNRVLARRLGVQVVRAHTRPVVLGQAWLARFVYFGSLVQRISEVHGDVVECGVADGSSLAALTSLITIHHQERQVWGFDSWAGLPTPSGADLGGRSIAVTGMFSHASTMRVHDELLAYGVSESDIGNVVKLVSGWFSETLPAYTGRIALLHIDVDLYQSYIDCLVNLWDRVEPGGVVAFDEYGEPEKWPGAQRAVDEFFTSRAGDATDLQHDPASGKWWVMKVSA
jgi:hypothetical protein